MPTLRSIYLKNSMSFLHFLFRQTKPLRIILSTIVLALLCIFLPSEYEKETPLNFELIYFLLIFIFFIMIGFIFTRIEDVDQYSVKSSPIFDQASSGTISLMVLSIPIYLLKPKLFWLAMLMLAMELGLVIGKYIYIRKNGRL